MTSLRIMRHVVILAIICCVMSATCQPHECQRVCRSDEPPRRCVYDFQVEYYFTLSKACYDCPLITEDCDRHHCIPADGVERGIIVVNRQLPGPSIQVCEGDVIVVDVKNRLPGEGSSIHWHGQHMNGTPYMDGVPMITQCPITPGSTFRYTFTAQNAGTHFWHSHTGFQRADGVFGSLIVRQSVDKDPHSKLYDFDLPEHVLLVSDWLGELGVSKFVAHHHDDGDNKPSSMLINGKGRLPRQLTANETMPLSRFQVQQGYRYRFRMISNGFLNCPIQVSVDNHTLLVIASDGHSVKPIEVTSLIISAGERYDFIITTNQAISTYWIRLHGLMDCKVNEVFQAAVLQYEGATEDEPSEELTYENTIRSGKTLNPVNMAPGDESHVTVAEMRSLDDNATDWTREPDQTFYLAYDFNPVNNLHFHDPEHYPIFGVDKNHRLFTPQINNISLRMPPSPLLHQFGDLPLGTLCNESTVSNCGTEFCDCTYTLNVALGSLVELVLIDEGFTFDATHPFHIHGTAFRVVGMHRVGTNVTVTQIKEMDRNGLIERNLINAPIKDTAPVPDGGYTIVRFFANNPGYWLFHCHLSFHIEVGMGLIFKVGEHTDFPPIPRYFPTCGTWNPDDMSPYGVTTETPAAAIDGNTNNNELSPFILSGVTYSHAKPTTIYQDNSIYENHLVNGTLSHSESQPNLGTSAGSSSVPQFTLIMGLAMYLLLHFLRT